MSEKAPHSPNQHEAGKNHEVTSERHESSRQPENQKSVHEKAQTAKLESLSDIRSEINKEAKKSEELRPKSSSQESNKSSEGPVKRQLQALMRERTLTRVRKELPAPQRALSKFVHSKPVEVISAAGEKTIARPYGLLGGGIAAFVGSVVIYLAAKNYGFKYNLFLFFTLFVGGYILASLVELLSKLAKKR